MTAAPLNPALTRALAPPIMEAAGWIRNRSFPPDRPLINLAQAAPADPPPALLREAIAEAALNQPAAHGYGPVLGDAALREEIAQRWSAAYGAPIEADCVAVTAGCNQAFCAAMASLAGAGDEVILPTPWYFNHKMWLDMCGARAVPLPCGESCLPDPEAAARLITPRTRALVLVTPNNPTGAVYPPALIAAFDDLAAAHGLALVLDETYRDYIDPARPPHDLFLRPGWRERLVHLYSFSKIFRLCGHRTGALITGPARLAEIEKFLDTVTICAPRLGQVAALAGLRGLGDWTAAERAEIDARRAALEREFAAGVGGWRLLGAGPFFAYVAHPLNAPAREVAKRLVDEQSLLILPGTCFAPAGGDGFAEGTMRIAFANVGVGRIAETAARLRAFAP